MDAKTIKPLYAGLITKILLFLVILNIVGNILNIVIWVMAPSWNDLTMRDSLNGGLIARFAGNDAALVISSAIIFSYAAVYAISAYGLLSKAKWAPLLIIKVSIVDRALALVIFELTEGFFYGQCGKSL
jgi:hypothetical protein